MEYPLSKLLYWLPRIGGIALILIWIIFNFITYGISVPNLDQLTIAGVLIVALIIAWQWPGWGSIIYFIITTIYAMAAYQRFDLLTIICTTIALLLIGLLFLISKYR